MPRQANKAKPAEKQQRNSGKFGKGNPHRFKPGVSGNPAGRPKYRTLSESLRHFLEQPVNKGKDALTMAEAIATAILEKARKGDVKAFIAISDRVEGKPKQRVELDGQVEVSLEASVTRIMELSQVDRVTAIHALGAHIPAALELLEEESNETE